MIYEEIQCLCQSHEVEGEVHTDTSYNTLTGAIYIPFAYEENQRNTMIKLFQSHGFVTIDQAKKNGMSMKRCEKCIVEKYSAAIVLEHCIINPALIIAPLQVIVESCDETKSFLDLSMHLPTELTCFKDDVRTTMNDHVLIHLKKDGCLVIDENELIYFSHGMISNILEKVLPPLIEDYARTNAENIADTIEDRKKTVTTKETSKTSTKSRGRSRKSMVENNVEKLMSYQDFKIPLQIVAEGIMKIYDDLVDIQETYSGNLSTSPQWEPEERSKFYEGPVYTFCRMALNNSFLSKTCTNAVEAEVEKVLQLRQGTSMAKSGRGAAKCRSIEEAFEESFPSACYYIQLTAKFSNAIFTDPDLSNEDEESLKRIFQSQCAWFAKRITEYCLFKANLEPEGIFSLHRNEDEEESDRSGDFSTHIDFTKFYSSNVFLSALGESTNPLKKLEEMFPGNVGFGLSRMWMLCGYDYYDCGEDFQADLERGDFDEFIAHIEEFCL